jgi:hypothetical protein
MDQSAFVESSYAKEDGEERKHTKIGRQCKTVLQLLKSARKLTRMIKSLKSGAKC